MSHNLPNFLFATLSLQSATITETTVPKSDETFRATNPHKTMELNIKKNIKYEPDLEVVINSRVHMVNQFMRFSTERCKMRVPERR